MQERPLSYWTALARMGFEDDLHRLMEEQDLSRSELASRIESSAPYVSKVLNGGGGNFTLETMAKFARAVRAKLSVRIVEPDKVVRVLTPEEAISLEDARAPRRRDRGIATETGIVVPFPLGARPVTPEREDVPVGALGGG